MTQFDRFSDGAKRWLVQSEASARTLGHIYVGPEHLLYGLTLCEDPLADKILVVLGVEAEHLQAAVRQGTRRGAPESVPAQAGAIRFTPQAKLVVQRAGEELVKRPRSAVDTAHALLALTRDEGLAGRILAKHAVTYQRVVQATAEVVDALAEGREPRPPAALAAEWHRQFSLLNPR